MTRCKAIRMMDCESLAKFLEKNFCRDCNFCPVYKLCDEDDFRNTCSDYLTRWLESDYK